MQLFVCVILITLPMYRHERTAATYNTARVAGGSRVPRDTLPSGVLGCGLGLRCRGESARSGAVGRGQRARRVAMARRGSDGGSRTAAPAEPPGPAHAPRPTARLPRPPRPPNTGYQPQPN